MGLLRFRRSVRLAPGVRLNFSGSGISATVGGRGHSVNFGRRGTYLNAGIPGTGLYMRERIGGGGHKAPVRVSQPVRRSAPQHVQMQVNIRLDESGVLHFEDGNGNPLPDNLIKKAKTQQRDIIRGLLEKQAKDVNDAIGHVEDIGLETPGPTEAPRFEPRTFEHAEPQQPIPRKPGILGWLFKAWVARTERLNDEAVVKFKADHDEWTKELQGFKFVETERKDYIERRIKTEPFAMEEFLENSFHEIHWPVEVEASFELDKDPTLLYLDAHLPEPSKLPHQRASVSDSRWNVSIKELSDKDRQQLYVRYAHGVGFRLVGEAFAALQTVNQIVISSFAEQPDPATGAKKTVCLYSAKVTRDGWSKISFSDLKNVEPAAALGAFEIRRKLSAAGVFSAVEAFHVVLPT